MAIDSGLGYASTKLGPRWHQRQPVGISRWHSLLAKWAIAVTLMLILTGLMLRRPTGILDMNTPHFGLPWLLIWFAVTVVSIGTLVLFAALGTLGQRIGLLIFVYLALASSGGTSRSKRFRASSSSSLSSSHCVRSSVEPDRSCTSTRVARQA